MVQEPHPPFPENISPSLRDFLTLCFARNPSNRPSAMQLLQHPWVTGDVADTGIRKRRFVRRQCICFILFAYEKVVIPLLAQPLIKVQVDITQQKRKASAVYIILKFFGDMGTKFCVDKAGGVVTILMERQRRDSETKRPNVMPAIPTVILKEDTLGSDSLGSHNTSYDDTMDGTLSDGAIFEMEPPSTRSRSGSGGVSESSLGSQLARLHLEDVDDAIYGAIDRHVGYSAPVNVSTSLSSFHLQATYSPRGLDDHFTALSEMAAMSHHLEISIREGEAHATQSEDIKRQEKKYERILGITSKDVEKPQENRRRSWRDRELYVDTPRDIEVKTRDIKELYRERKDSRESEKERERREKKLHKEFEKSNKSKEKTTREEKVNAKSNKDDEDCQERKSRHNRRSMDYKRSKNKDTEKDKEREKEAEKDRCKAKDKSKHKKERKEELDSDSDSSGVRSRSRSRSRVHSPGASPPSSPRKGRPIDFINALQRSPKLDDVRPQESAFANPPLSPRSRNNSLESKNESATESRERSKSRTATVGDTTTPSRKESVGETSKPKLKKHSSNEADETTGKSFFSRFSLSKNKEEPPSPRSKSNETSDEEAHQSRATLSAPSSPLARSSSTRPLSPKRPTSPKFTLAFPAKLLSSFSSKLSTTPSIASISKPPSPPSSPTLAIGHLPDPPPLHLEALDSSPSPRRRRNATREDALATFLDISSSSPRSAPSSFNHPPVTRDSDLEAKSLFRKSEYAIQMCICVKWALTSTTGAMPSTQLGFHIMEGKYHYHVEQANNRNQVGIEECRYFT